MEPKSSESVLVHFVAKHGAETELEQRLRNIGFETVQRLPRTPRVLVRATAVELRERLNITIEWENRSQTLVFKSVEVQYPQISPSSKLPKPISRLVKSFYTPPPLNHGSI